MPIRSELRLPYALHWHALGRRVRFKRTGSRCQVCGRQHLTRLRGLSNGSWLDETASIRRDRRGRIAHWPDLVEVTPLRTTRVMLAAAYIGSNPSNNRLRSSRAPHHLAQQRWITYRRRWTMGDLFLGFYRQAERIPG